MIKLDNIGATTVRIGEKAVAKEFFSCVRLDMSMERELFISSEYIARLSAPSFIPLFTVDIAPKTVENRIDIPSILARLMLVLFALLCIAKIPFASFLSPAKTVLPVNLSIVENTFLMVLSSFTKASLNTSMPFLEFIILSLTDFRMYIAPRPAIDKPFNVLCRRFMYPSVSATDPPRSATVPLIEE